MSRQHHNPPTDPPSSSQGDSPTDRRPGGETNTSGEGDSPRDASSKPTPISREATNSTSEREEGYPSWLPKRPPPPAPASTFTSVGMPTPVSEYPGRGATPDPFAYVGGRKATPRSVRIISMASQAEKDPYARREPTDQTRVSGAHQHARVWSRATSGGLSTTLFSAGSPFPLHVPRPRFRANGLHLELLRNPSWRSRLHFYLWPFFIFYDIPLQTFFDFNAVFILIQVAKFPDPLAPGVPGSGRNWALGVAAYIACWFAWIFFVFLIYQLIYSFYRRWRVKRPLMLPLYMSSPAFNFVCMTSYSNFSFFQHLRSSAFKEESNGSLRDGLAETFYYYSQNLPTVALLLPRAGLSLALLLTFWTPNPDYAALGTSPRDGTFFDPDGTLTGYAKGVLIANAAWTAWRVLVLMTSWLGLWALSGQLFAGLCGPRYRWEEDDAEKTMSVISDGASDGDALPWSWRECTRLRVQEAYEFCLTTRPPRRAVHGGEKKEVSDVTVPESARYEGMEQIMAAIGLPTGGAQPYPPKRGVLSQDLFESPQEVVAEKGREEVGQEEEEPVPVPAPSVGKGKGRAVFPGDEAPFAKVPYAFTGHKAQISSTSVPHDIPFPPSPVPPEEKSETEEHTEEEEEEEEEGEEGEGEAEESRVESEQTSSPRARSSASMSSLGRPVNSRYPFQFRRPTRGHSISTASHSTPHTRSTNSRSTPSTDNSNSRHSRATQSTGNRSSTDDNSPRSYLGSSPSVSGIPRPPRNPAAGRRRAGTVPSLPSSPSPVVFSELAGGPRGSRFRTESDDTAASPSFIQDPPYVMSEAYETGSEDESPESSGMMEQPEAEGSQEAAEIGDSVALLTSDAGPTLSPRASLAHIRSHGSGVSLGRRRNGSRSGSGSRSRTNSSHASARSRAHSLIQSISAASRSSLELVSSGLRSRTSSMARLEDSPGSSDRSRSVSDAVRSEMSGSGSGSASDALSSPENHTFGHPLREHWRETEGDDSRLEEEEEEDLTGTSIFETPAASTPPELGPRLRGSPSASSAVPSSRISERTVHLDPPGQAIPGARPGTTRPRVRSATQPSRESESPPDISTAAPSFITAPPSMSRTSESTMQVSRTPESQWAGHVDHFLGAEGRREYWGPN
ncbi:hypothetical protein GLOTRDRAFT_139978 [Gloeophyllum trabeum ATCC 11539]|uniref:Uncharacterized protein n=1 Tax=Gloeophyllum trabeum (strain ATCC 11539 / FP-39264 / Madison 617) TaxID=670483 RepID=S7Q018_GLOTA|nr:uncharacterized protein GLOTRDRAFT_139978 [Gloeophyllum trabeum ATCC 11539]EPQ53028.1 hypothetical protein GLOTRDRAFT_139978 [Gloeophyllum trabeum ATCC 11539]